MKKGLKTIQFSILLGVTLIIVSCSMNQSAQVAEGNEQIVDFNEIDFFLCSQMQQATRTQYFIGQEHLYDIKEMTMDRSAPNRQLKAKKLAKQMFQVDEALNQFLRKINDVKTEISPNMNAVNEQWMISDIRKGFTPNFYILEGKKLILTERAIEETAKLKFALADYRKSLVESLITESFNGNPVTFEYPILDIDTDPMLANSTLKAAMDVGNVSHDDREAIRRLDYNLLKLAAVSPKNINSVGSFLGFLLSIERGVFDARAIALSTIRYKVGGANFYIDKMNVVVECPTSCYAGEELVIKTYIAASNSLIEPEGTIDQAAISSVENGMVTHKVIAGENGEIRLSGTTTTYSKSGEPITLPWERTVKVLPK